MLNWRICSKMMEGHLRRGAQVDDWKVGCRHRTMLVLLARAIGGSAMFRGQFWRCLSDCHCGIALSEMRWVLMEGTTKVPLHLLATR